MIAKTHAKSERFFVVLNLYCVPQLDDDEKEEEEEAEYYTGVSGEDQDNEEQEMDEAKADSARKDEDSIYLNYEAAQAFFRSLGFRRIGSSSWFALASDANHPCHSIDVAADFNPPTGPMRATVREDQCKIHEICQWEDSALVEHLESTFQNASPDDTRWKEKDRDGNTWLHWAARYSKPRAVSWILTRNPGLIDDRDDFMLTALDSLEDDLEQRRTDADTRHGSVQFTGFSDDSVECVVLLKKLNGLSEIDRLRLKYGCTCGQCIGGFLSPRMAYTIRSQAELLCDILYDMKQHSHTGPDFVEDLRAMYLVVPWPVYDEMESDGLVCAGFANFFRHFATCVQLGRIPDQQNVLRALEGANERPAVSYEYLNRGGTVSAIGSSVFRQAWQEDEVVGDGDPDEDTDDERDKLPRCRNDLEYNFVSALCGYERSKRIARGHYDLE